MNRELPHPPDLSSLRDFMLGEEIEETDLENYKRDKPRQELSPDELSKILAPRFLKDEDYDLEPEDEETPEFIDLRNKMHNDQDLISSLEYLNEIKDLSFRHRVYLLVDSARETFTCPKDFATYFEVFPDDANQIISLVLSDNEDLSSFKIYQLGSKVFEAACQTNPEYWTYMQKLLNTDFPDRDLSRLKQYLEISARSHLARESMLGEYKKTPLEVFSKYPSELLDKAFELFLHIEDLNSLQDSGVVRPEMLFESSEFKSLSPEEKTRFAQDIIVHCHNSVIFHEVYNSCFGPQHKEERGDYNGRGIHSILYKTRHTPRSYQRQKYFSFDTNYTAFADGSPVDECGYELTALEAIRQLGNTPDLDTVDFLMNFWDKNLDPAYGPEIAATISTLNPQRGIENILTKLPQTEEADKRRLLSLLFRLELGAIGISTGGVNYLGRRFDLGEENNPDYFVQRITADGKVGVFDETQTMRGFFQLEAGDFSAEAQEVIQKNLSQIVQEMLFLPKADETEEEKSNRIYYLQQFNEQYFQTYLGDFSQKSGIPFNNLTLKEQGWTFAVLHSQDDEQKERVYRFAKSFGENALRSLIATEYGIGWGDRLLKLTESLSTDQMRSFLSSFANLISESEIIGETVNELLVNTQETSISQLSGQLTEALIRKNKDFIAAAELITQEKITFQDLIKSMNEYAFVLAQMQKALDQNGLQYQKLDKKTETQGETTVHTNWLLADKDKHHQVNILIRPMPALTSVIDKQTGEKKQITAQAGIRLTFVWPDKRRFGIRLDMDPFYKDENFSNGRLTLDIGSRDSTIGQILQTVSDGGYHNTISFSPELSSPEKFSSLCRSLEDALEARFSNPEPTVDDTVQPNSI